MTYTYFNHLECLCIPQSHKERKYSKHARLKKSSIMAVCVIKMYVVLVLKMGAGYGASDSRKTINYNMNKCMKV